MKITVILSILLSIFFISCGDDSGNSAGDSETITNKTISGVVQIGPFEKGATIAVYELDEKFEQTGRNYETEIENDQGEYSVDVKELKSQYALLKASGYYRNLTTNKQSMNKITLYAIVNILDDGGFNVNVLTHLAYKRTIYLITQKKMHLEEARKQAESEILKFFGMDDNFKEAGKLDILGKGNQSEALFTLSILMQCEIPKNNTSKRLELIATDFEEDGTWDDEKTKALVADFFYEQFEKTRYSDIQDNIANLYPSIVIPSFDKFINHFWWNIYGLKDCIEKRKNEIAPNKNSNSDFVKKQFICRPGIWRAASDKEISKYYWPDNLDSIKGKEGDTYIGKNDTTICYVYRNNSWEKSDPIHCIVGLCTEKNQDVIQKGTDGEWYKCNKLKWEKSDECAYTISKWKDGKEGEIRHEEKCNDQCYVYDNGQWRLGNVLECNLSFAVCTPKRTGTIQEAPVLNTKMECDEELYFNEKSYYNTCITEIISIDTTQKTFYICRDDSNHNFDLMHAELKYLTYKTGGLTYFWNIASDTEINTEGLSCSEEGKLVSGIKNPQKQYLCDRGSFREAKEIEIAVGLGCTPHTYGKFEILKGTKSYLMCDSLFEGDTTYFYWDVSPEKNQGTMTDPRDNTIYKTINIGTQTWMAENLNFADSTKFPSILNRNSCEEDTLDNCEIYGRLYTWSAAIDSVYWSSKGITCGYTPEKDSSCELSETVQGICPKDWHIPSVKEWDTLYEWMTKYSMNPYMSIFENVGFLPQEFYNEIIFWASNDFDGQNAYEITTDYTKYIKDGVRYAKDYSGTSPKNNQHYIRCVKND